MDMGWKNQYVRFQWLILLWLLAGVFVFVSPEYHVAAQTCTPYWSCTVWSACSNDAQARSCTDLNNCGSQRRPAETQACPTGPEIIPDIAPTGGDLSGTAPATSNPTTCTPSWECTAWSACNNGYQARTCSDGNFCGTLQGIPLQSASCESPAVTCTPIWECAAWSVCTNGAQTRSCSDLRNCGVTAGKPPEQQSCTAAAAMCSPAWSCTAWSACSSGLETRTCTDGNSCGTVTGKPAEQQICVQASVPPATAPPPGCSPAWSCTAWSACSSGLETRTCTDGNSCGTVTGKPAEQQACTAAPSAVQDATPPTIPTNLTATPAAPTQVNLTWNPSTDNVAVSGYQIYRNDVRIATVTLPNYVDTTVTAVTWYTYAVVATDAAGNVSALSVVANVLTPPPTDESAPTITAAAVVAVTQNTATISWQTNELAVSSVEYGITTSYGLVSPWTAVFATAHTAVLAGLNPGNGYHYRLTVRDSSGNLARSQDFTFRTVSADSFDGTPPPPVVDLAIADVQQTSLVLRWTSPQDVSGVRSLDIRYAMVPLTPQNFLSAARVQTLVVPAPLGTRQSHYVSVGLTPGGTYFFALTATDGAGNVSPLSNVPQATMLSAPTTVSQTPSTEPGTLSIPIRSEDGIVIIGYTVYQLDDAIAPAAPRQVVGQGTDTQVTLRWVNPTEPDFVRVQVHRSVSAAATVPGGGVIIYEGRDETFTDLTAVNGVTYTYRVSAFDRSGNFAPPVYVRVAARAGVTQADAPVVAGVAAGGKRLAWLVVGRERRQLFVIFADGSRRLIGSLALAEQLGIPVGSATVVDEQALVAYPLGRPLAATDTDVREVLDSDVDALADAFEDRLGTDPARPDTDRDGIPDGQELSDGTDPRFPLPSGPVPPDLAQRAAGRFAVSAGGEHPVYYITPDVPVRLPIPNEAVAWQVVARRSLQVPHQVVRQIPLAADTTAKPDLPPLAARLEGRIIVDTADGRAWYVRSGVRYPLPPGRLPERVAALAQVFPAADLARIPYQWLGP